MDTNLKKTLQQYANTIRKDVITEVFNAQSGHPGGSLSVADVMAYLYFKEMNVDASNPAWEDRDRFVLSKGHTCPALYSALAHKGFFDPKELVCFRKLGHFLQGHPDMNKIPGVDMSSGSLGQGVSAAVGMALAAKVNKKDYRVYTLLGDGEIQEGQVWEAAMFASHYNLGNLCVMVDSNGLQIDGAVDEVMSPNPIDSKFEAFGFRVTVVDGHDFDALEKAFEFFNTPSDKPTAIILKTIKGKGVSYMENVAGWHGKAPDEELYNQAMADLAALDA